MAVIIPEMDMPTSCSDCTICHCKGKDDPWNYYCAETMDDINIEEWDKERYITCPLKSTEGLIEKIQNAEFTVTDGYGYWFMTPLEIKDDVIRIIKEYCGEGIKHEDSN